MRCTLADFLASRFLQWSTATLLVTKTAEGAWRVTIYTSRYGRYSKVYNRLQALYRAVGASTEGIADIRTAEAPAGAEGASYATE